MRNFKKPGSFSGSREGSSFGRPNAGRSSFNNRGRDDGFGRSEMYEAVCANCGNKCEVPFRPNGQKPVYCKECFGKMGGGSGGDRFAKRDFSPRPSSRPQFENRSGGSGDQTTKLLESLNGKLERLIQAVEALGSRRPVTTEVQPKESPKEIPVAVIVPKKVSKKAAVKK